MYIYLINVKSTLRTKASKSAESTLISSQSGCFTRIKEARVLAATSTSPLLEWMTLNLTLPIYRGARRSALTCRILSPSSRTCERMLRFNSHLPLYSDEVLLPSYNTVIWYSEILIKWRSLWCHSNMIQPSVPVELNVSSSLLQSLYIIIIKKVYYVLLYIMYY